MSGACIVCGLEQDGRGLAVWRDLDGEGWWIHPECGVGFTPTARSRIEQLPVLPDVATADNPDVEACTFGGVDHDWRPHEYMQFNQPHISWRCVWCHAVACGDYAESDPCMQPYHHRSNHLSRSGIQWPVGGDRPRGG